MLNRASQPAPHRQRVPIFPSPRVEDLIFYDTVDAQRVGDQYPAYGTAHPDTARYPNHKLVLIQQDDPTGQLLRYYYAADRDQQDLYNYEFRGQDLIRTYVIPRTDYPAELPVPDGGEPDATYTSLGFVNDELVDLGEPLSTIYVAITRTYSPITVVEYPYSGPIEGNLSVTRTIKPAGYELADDSLESVPGDLYEVQYGNRFHNVLIHRQESTRAATTDATNFRLVEGEYLERYYIIERSDYPTGYPVPDGGDPDPTYPAYGFVSDSLVPIDGELQGGLVKLVRRFEPIVVTEQPYDPQLERNTTLTRTIKPSGTTLASLGLESGSGIIHEIKHGNEFHDLLITTDTGLITAPSGNLTVNAGTDVFTSTAHGLQDGDAIVFSSTGTLPSPLTAGTIYFVRDRTANIFKVSTLPGGSALNITTTGSGTHSFARVAKALKTIYTTLDSYPFPPRLDSYDILYSHTALYETVYSSGDTPRASYSEDLMPSFELSEPSRGPFMVALYRWVLEDAYLLLSTLLARYPQFPETKRETVVVGFAAARFVNFFTTASLREFAVPESYHAAVTIGNIPPTDSPALDYVDRYLEPATLPATTGFTGDFVGNYLVAANSKDTTGDLQEVTATVMMLNGIY